MLASAQTAPPVPTVEEPEPGFEEGQPAPELPPSKYGRTPARSESAPPLGAPKEPEEQNEHDHLIELIEDTTGVVELSEVVDEVLADVMATLVTYDARHLGPLALREVRVSGVAPSFAPELRARLIAFLNAGTEIRVRRCLECVATRTRVEDEQLIITRGVTHLEQLQQIGRRLGVKTFMDVAFAFEPEASSLQFDFQVFSASSGEVMWAETYRSDTSTPMLMRASERPQKRSERVEDLRALLEGRPLFGWQASIGIMLMPYDDPLAGDIFGTTAGLRLYERFGTDRRVLFGLDLMGFINVDTLSGAIASAGAWWVPLEPDLVNPELRVGGKAGAFIAGSEGNAGILQLGAELLLRYRFGLYAYATYVFESSFPGPNANPNAALGGVGMSAGVNLNW